MPSHIYRRLMPENVLVVISDTHIGSTTALAPQTYELHNRNTLELSTVQANTLQTWVYNCWTDFWNYIDYVRGTGKKRKRLVTAHLGDVIDGVHHQSTQLIAEVGDQYKMALDLLEPIRDKSSYFIGIFGTGAHAGQDHATEAAIYRELSADFIGQNIVLELDGLRHDLAHHGRTGTRPWTTGATNLAAEIIIDYALTGDPLPNYIFRGHRHVIDDSGSKFEITRLIQCPAWQLKTSHGWEVAGNTVRSDIGGVIVNENIVDLAKSRYGGQPDKRKVIRL